MRSSSSAVSGARCAQARRLLLSLCAVAALGSAVACRFDGAGQPIDGRPTDQQRDLLGSDLQRLDGPRPDAPAVPGFEPGDGRLLFGRVDDEHLHASRYAGQSGSWTGDGKAWSGTTVHWVLTRLSASAELAAVKVTENLQDRLLLLAHVPGGAWTSEGVLAASTDVLEYRDFGLAIEGQSGNAMFVFGGAAGELLFRHRLIGSWAPAQAVPLLDGANIPVLQGTVRWVELVAHATSDRVAAAVADDAGTLAVAVWDGAQWSVPVQLSTSLKKNGGSGDLASRSFDAAFEQSGDLLVAWGSHGGPGVRWTSRAVDGSWSPFTTLSTPGGGVDFVDLEADPASDRIAAVFMVQGDTERLGLATWTGSGWSGADEYTTAVRDLNNLAPGDFTAAVGWSGGQAVAVYPGLLAGELHWYHWAPGGDERWQPGAPLKVPGKGKTESVLLGTSRQAGSALVAVFSDDKRALYGAHFVAGSWSLAQHGQSFATQLERPDTVCFDVSRR